MELEIKNVSHTYKNGKKALSEISTSLTPGVYGLLGPNGAGKSTLMNIITDNLRPTAGEVSLDGNVIWKNSNAYRARLGYMPQQQGLYSSFTGTRFLWYMAALKGLSHREAKTRVNELLELVNLKDAADRRIGGYSGGMKQRVVIAIAMICNPDLIICDEPTTALDVTIQAQIMELLKELQVKEGKSIVLITHNMGLVAEMADEVCVMYMGRVVEFGKLEDIFDNTCHPYTRALLRSVPVLGMPEGQKLETIPGSTPNPADLKEGCEFADRCSECTEKCRKGTIPNYEVSPGHYVRCVRFDSYPEVKR